jgi:hypothetical protein
MNDRHHRSIRSWLAARALPPVLVLLVMACSGERTGEAAARAPADTGTTESHPTDPRSNPPGVTRGASPADPAGEAVAAGNAAALPILARLAEYEIRLSVTELREGRVAISFRNEGKRVHTIEIRGDNAMRWRTLPIRPGTTATLTMHLPAGRYIVRSVEPPYVDRGMTALLLVR